MSSCCVSGCKNRHSSTSKLRFYRIPSAKRPFQANRRRLWLQAIQQVNGSVQGLRGNVRICGAHFISGEASMDHDSPDFVPSVFSCTKSSPKKTAPRKRLYGRRRKRCHKVSVKTEEMATSPRADSPVESESSVLMETKSDVLEEMQTPPTSPVPKETEMEITKEAETESGTKTEISQTTSSPNQASWSFKLPADIPKHVKMSPIVLLKPLIGPTGEYECEQCSQNFASISQLMKHKQLHEEQKTLICEICGKQFMCEADLTEHQPCHTVESFPCNICDRSFTTNHNLKRHKLLHVRDGRKCSKCGVLFCQRHNHVLFLPQVEPVIKSEPDLSDEEPQSVESNVKEENVLPEKPEQNQTPDLDDGIKSSPPTSVPLPVILKIPPQVMQLEILPKTPPPSLPESSSVPSPPPREFKIRKKTGSSSGLMPPPPIYRRGFLRPALPQDPELPPSLKLFSPRFLTSALLEVKRNYDYILSEDVKRDTVKDEQCELPLHSSDEQEIKKERTAYDLEIVV